MRDNFKLLGKASLYIYILSIARREVGAGGGVGCGVGRGMV